MDSNYNNTIQSKTIDQIHRIIISKALSQKDNVTTIAKELGFSRQSIHKEIKRGTIIKRNSDWTEAPYYDHYAAQYKHIQTLSNRGSLSKIDDDRDLMDFVINHLKSKKSPEVIASLIHKDDSFINKISAKIIYNWIYSGDLDLDYKVLPYGKRRHRKAKNKEKLLLSPMVVNQLNQDLISKIESNLNTGGNRLYSWH